METTSTVHIQSITQLHQLLGLPKPTHPLVSLIQFEQFPPITIAQRTRLITDFYQITLKTECPCRIQYGQSLFDFEEGVMSCFGPKQVSFLDQDFVFATAGWHLCIHPDFLRTFPLGSKIKSYGYFDYAVNEALILSDEEQQAIEAIFLQLRKESLRPIDKFSQEVWIANIELLLTYCNRYYNRQFITRKAVSSELLAKVEQVLNTYFAAPHPDLGLLTAQYVAESLHLSPKYLSDCLKQLTGSTTQQLIHERLIEQAKEQLLTTTLSVSEIAYALGFEYPQSFSKLFKAKTQQTPLQFRADYR
ncbi:helix-turn-helix domain-containing protein [Hymenobacter cellulosilyticus]|uniref:Helix-turn-helix domain-containing protein n=1 Tax=Hymenobacter cellulosilyticus TaxID=2932248 RepID=A0A8T9QHU4_9BACT|nr:helix-turn-helix domain-containing protein [Hymenobacter cellulosilyticus]UOQ74373.1 helix-turn-helix domain-containing protein [Hymenobacter cellulosilyticus]